jgi:hypothetical protein
MSYSGAYFGCTRKCKGNPPAKPGDYPCIYTTLTELQTDLAEWLRYYNEERVHQGRWCDGCTPRQTFLETLPLAKEKVFAA